MTNKGGSTPACAACKYQRRRCTPACPLAPYFPANNPRMFQNVHRLFGVASITKILSRLDTTEQRDEAMRSIIYEANARQKFPARGCCEVIQRLLWHLQCAEKELEIVKALIVECKEQQRLNLNNNNNNNIDDNNDEIGYENRINYGGDQFLFDENNGGFPFDNLLSGSMASVNNWAAVQAQMDALNMQEAMNVFPVDLQIIDI